MAQLNPATANEAVLRSNRRFEQALVTFFLVMPPIGLLVVLYHALQNGPMFWTTVLWIAYLCGLIGAHIKWIRPIFRRYPWVASYKELIARSKPLRSKHPKLVAKAWRSRLLRTGYRLAFVAALAPFFLAMHRLHGHHFWWFIGMYHVAGFGITVGYHRIGTHPSFKTSKWMRGFLLAMGCFAVQGPPAEWMKKHSKHHAFGETTADVHTPWIFDDTKRGIFREQVASFFHSFVMWAVREPSLTRPRGMSLEEFREHLLKQSPDPATFRFREEDRDFWEVRDKEGKIVMSTEQLIKARWGKLVEKVISIEADPVVKFLSNPLVYIVILVANFAIPYYLGGIGIWESLARVCYVNWVTFCVNSICHIWGEKPFETPDNSRNNAVVEILALGEGGHNTHHKSELWARHGVFGWQFDPAYRLIETLRFFGLASNLNLATKEQIVRAWRDWRRREPEMIR